MLAVDAADLPGLLRPDRRRSTRSPPPAGSCTAAVAGTSLQGPPLQRLHALAGRPRPAAARRAGRSRPQPGRRDAGGLAGAPERDDRTGPRRPPRRRGGRASATVWSHHYLYGGKEGVAERMADELRRTVPGISVVGTETPPFRPLSDDDLDELVERVRESGANVLWIGLGTPRPGLPRAPARPRAPDADRARGCGLRLLVRRGQRGAGDPARQRPGVAAPPGSASPAGSGIATWWATRGSWSSALAPPRH